MEEEDNIIVKWAQEDVERSYSLLNNNNIHIYIFTYILYYIVCFWHNGPQWVRISSFTRFLEHTQRHTTVGRTPVDG